MKNFYKNKEEYDVDLVRLKSEIKNEMLDNDIRYYNQKNSRKTLIISLASAIIILYIICSFINEKWYKSDYDKINRETLKENIKECLNKGYIKMYTNEIAISMEELYTGECNIYAFNKDYENQCFGEVKIKKDNEKYFIDITNYCKDYR